MDHQMFPEEGWAAEKMDEMRKLCNLGDGISGVQYYRKVSFLMCVRWSNQMSWGIIYSLWYLSPHLLFRILLIPSPRPKTNSVLQMLYTKSEANPLINFPHGNRKLKLANRKVPGTKVHIEPKPPDQCSIRVFIPLWPALVMFLGLFSNWTKQEHTEIRYIGKARKKITYSGAARGVAKYWASSSRLHFSIQK